MRPDQLWLAAAILCEVIATSALKASDGLQHWRPAVLVVVGYVCAFYALAQALRTIPVGVAYAIWSGVGIVMVSLIGFWLFKQRLSVGELSGIALIGAGVLVLQLAPR
ncbi:multidrug efflux SMR transporter [uncultured Rhodoferax sp.]|uniref:DMT family transporter n=1 Tax=uncultured Rhodoferax sp. TaxID=223188 RepID=UPI0025FEE039|nr:multidrug efflux SMR transporter [uncultured Rhodoferax sp.]